MNASLPCRHIPLPRHDGLTLAEFIVSLALSMFVLLATTSLLLTSKTAYTTNDDAAVVQESGRYALEVIVRALRQAGHEDWGGANGAVLGRADDGASISGLDARSLKSTGAGMDVTLKQSVNGSDVLGIRFYGSGAGEHGDGSMLNCAGFGVPSGSAAEPGWSIFFVAEDSTGEPELRCKYRGKSSWNAVAIARGVESFQVLYGVDTDADGMPDHFLDATRINELDDALVLVGKNAGELAADRQRNTYWKKVVAVRIAMLLRGANASRGDALNKVYDLFGKDYGDFHGSSDKGARIDEASLPLKQRNRIRKIFSATILLRNQSPGEMP